MANYSTRLLLTCTQNLLFQLNFLGFRIANLHVLHFLWVGLGIHSEPISGKNSILSQMSVSLYCHGRAVYTQNAKLQVTVLSTDPILKRYFNIISSGVTLPEGVRGYGMAGCPTD